MVNNYYDDKLHSDALFKVYEMDILRIRQHLSEEINFVKNLLKSEDTVLELGAG